MASRNLTSAEKFSLGGATGVRAYPSGEALGDTGYVFQGELRYIIPASRSGAPTSPFPASTTRAGCRSKRTSSTRLAVPRRQRQQPEPERLRHRRLHRQGFQFLSSAQSVAWRNENELPHPTPRPEFRALVQASSGSDGGVVLSRRQR